MLYSLFPKFEHRTIRNYLTVLGLLFFLVLLVNSQAFPQSFAEANKHILESMGEYGRIPLHFEANHGQAEDSIEFIARGQGYNLYLTGGEVTLVLSKSLSTTPLAEEQKSSYSTVHMQLLGANSELTVVEQEKLPGTVNYFIGNDPDQWQTNIPTYSKVHYENVYPGIDLVYYGNQQQLEYDFIVSPETDPNVITLNFVEASALEIDMQGNLLISTDGEQIVQKSPIIYQEIDGVRQSVDGGYVVEAGNLVGFEVGPYDTSKPLIIDPVVIYGTYLGGSGLDLANDIAVDSNGNAYVTGRTPSTDFPVQNPYQTNYGGSISDVFITKLDASGSSFLYSTYLGGGGFEEGYGIKVDPSGNAFIVGYTTSTNYPTFNPLQASNAGGNNMYDAFLTKLDPSGSTLAFSTYLGGQCDDRGFDLAIDMIGNSYITGETGNCSSNNFPTVNPFQSNYSGSQDVFVTKINAAATGIDYSTYLGGNNYDSGSGITVDTAGFVYVTGLAGSATFPTLNGFQSILLNGDAFITKLDPSQTGSASLLYSTFFGGSGSDEGDDIAVDANGHVYITGQTDSIDFPTLNPIQSTFGGSFADAYVAKLDPSQTGTASLIYSTYIGANGQDRGHGIAVDNEGNAYITGQAGANFPLVNPLAPSNGAFITKVNTVGDAFDYSTYIGGYIGQSVAIDANGDVYVTGYGSSGIPVLNAAQPTSNGSYDAFIIKLHETCSTTVENLNDSGTGSLREAINCANSNSGDDVIDFAVSGTVNILTQLPDLNDPTGGTTIDGTTAPGYAGTPVVVLQGQGSGTGLQITSSNNTIRGIQIGSFNTGIKIIGSSISNNQVAGNFIGTDGTNSNSNFIGIQIDESPNNLIGTDGDGLDDQAEKNVISGNTYSDIFIIGLNSAENLIQGNFIGTNVNGTADLLNSPPYEIGILIYNAPNNVIGGVTSEKRNIISGISTGISIVLENATGNKIQGNFIGTDVTGTNGIGNSSRGIRIADGASNTIIGGTTSDAKNLISYQNGHAIEIQGGGANIIQGNFIGTDITGSVALPNSGAGMEIVNSANNVIGGAIPGAGNLISGNNTGIGLVDVNSTGNIVQGNLIGTDVTGEFALGNNSMGVHVGAASNNMIGGTATGAGNVIAGNGQHGIYIFITSSSDNQIQGNKIGLNINGDPLGNGWHGIYLEGNNNTIGGSGTGSENVIAFNGWDGVFVDAGSGNAILSNRIHSNLHLGIDLNPNGVTANDPDDVDSGANELQNYPVLTNAESSTGSTDISGTLNSLANTTFTLEFFSNSSCDPSGNGEGELFLSSDFATTDGSGNANFDVTIGTAVPVGDFITATATDPNGNTSEFSACFAVTTPPPPISIIDVSPNNAAFDVDNSTTVSATFDLDVDASTISKQTFTVRGEQTGVYTGTYTASNSLVQFDNHLDFKSGEEILVTLNQDIQSTAGASLSPYSWQFYTAVGGGFGTFVDSSQALGNRRSHGIALGDLDGDGDLDAFVGNIGFSISQGQPDSIWLNDGNGSFTDSGQALGSNTQSYHLVLGDLDNDGDLDAFTANFTDGNRVYLNNGGTQGGVEGIFSESSQQLGSSSSLGAALADLDGDGDLDAFVANYYSQPNRVWLNDGFGNFTDSGQTLGNSNSNDVALGDLDGDGDLDAFVGNDDAQPNRVWLNDGAGIFTDSGQALGNTSTLGGVSLGDLDGDGDLDAFVGVRSAPHKVWLNDGAGSFTVGQNIGGSQNAHGSALGDLDGDGDLDAFIAHADGVPNEAWLNNGNGIFTLSGSYGNGYSEGVALGDVDGDGDIDAFITNDNQPNKVWFNHPLNQPPIADNDSFSTNEDVILNEGAPGVLDNDTDVDGDPLTAVLDTTTTNGTLALNSDGSFGYTPDANFCGQDSFTYHANDGTADSNIATVTIDVVCVNDAPVAGDDNYSVDEDTVLNESVPGVLSDDTDVENDPLTAVLNTTTSNGTLLLNTDGSFTYTPNPDFCGQDSFTYYANDGTVNSQAATVSIAVVCVNDDPDAVDDNVTTDEDTAVIVDVLANDTDVDTGDVLTVVTVTQGSHGTVTSNGVDVTYTPNADYCNSDSFTYTISDGNGGTGNATVTVTVNCINDNPIAVDDDNYNATEDTTLNVTAPGVLDNDFDVDGDSLTAVLDTTTSNGVLNLNTDGSFNYIPSADFCGQDSFTYQTNDGTADSNLATVTIEVICINDAPAVEAGGPYDVAEGGSILVEAIGIDPDDDILTYEWDLDNDGIFEAPGQNVIFSAETLTGPATQTIGVQVTDSEGVTAIDQTTVNIIQGVCPSQVILYDDFYSNALDTGIWRTDTNSSGSGYDIQNGVLYLDSGTTFGGGFAVYSNQEFTPAGYKTFSLEMKTRWDIIPDAGTGFGFRRIGSGFAIAGTDRLTGEFIMRTFEDEPGTPDTFVIGVNPAVIHTYRIEFNNDNLLFYVDNVLEEIIVQNVPTNIQMPVFFSPGSPGGVHNIMEVDFVKLTATLNCAPDAVDDSYNTNEDVTFNVSSPGVLNNDTDKNDDTLTAVLDNTTSNGDLTLNSDGSFNYIPNDDFCGQDSFTYYANDGVANSDTPATVTIDVACINDAPVAVIDNYSVDEDDKLIIAAAGVLTNDLDVENDSLTAVLNITTTHGTLTLNSDGSFNYTPNDDFCEQDSFTYYANDGVVNSDAPATVTIDVVCINDAPEITVDNASIVVDEGNTAVNSGKFSDIDSTVVTLSASVGTVIDNGNGNWSWSFDTNDGPTENQDVTIMASDGEATSQVIFSLTVNNIAPAVDTLTVPLTPINLNDQSTFTVDVTFSDPAGAADEFYTCAFDLDYDGVTFTADATESNVTGTSCSTTLNYAEPGVYTVKVIVTDKDGDTGSAMADEFIVIYDPSGGFVTGGGWIWSESGWCQLAPICAGAEGKANFGFVSKYKKGASVPTGKTEFNFSAGNLNFHSDLYDWLVVNQGGTNAQYKGSGTINGNLAPNDEMYKFMIWAADGDNVNPTQDDAFRIKIWYEDSGEIVVYDNGTDQIIGGGNIKIHDDK